MKRRELKGTFNERFIAFMRRQKRTSIIKKY